MTILIADDEFIERRFLQKHLTQMFGERCSLLVAANGQEALDLYAEHQPQILILDIEMPGMSGLEAAARIRETDKKCSIIFLTAYDDFHYAKQAIQVRALDYLLKPCDTRELQTVVEEALYLAGEETGTEPQPVETAEEDRQELREDEDAGLSADQAAGGQQEKIRKYIEENYMRPLSVQDIAGHFGYADAYFCRIFKQHFGKSLVTYLTDYRVQKAKELFGVLNGNIKDISQAVGYEDPNYFAKVFRRATGMSPRDFRDSI